LSWKDDSIDSYIQAALELIKDLDTILSTVREILV